MSLYSFEAGVKPVASCKCGATVTYVRVADEIFPLEQYEAVSGERFQIVDFTTEPWTAVAIDQSSPESGYLDHRLTCPHQ